MSAIIFRDMVSAMDVADLKVFEAVARLGGMNRAAANLNTVQSNVTARIRLLEEELGAPLFDGRVAPLRRQTAESGEDGSARAERRERLSEALFEAADICKFLLSSATGQDRSTTPPRRD